MSLANTLSGRNLIALEDKFLIRKITMVMSELKKKVRVNDFCSQVYCFYLDNKRELILRRTCTNELT